MQEDMSVCWKGFTENKLVQVAIAVLVFTFPASADLGRLSWGALTPENRTAAGRTLYGGDVKSPLSQP